MMLQKTPLPRAAQPRRGVGRGLKPFPAWSRCRQNKACDTIAQAQPQQGRAAQTKKGYLEPTHEQLITSDLCLQKQEVAWKRRCRRCLSPWERHRPGDPSRASTARGNRALGWEEAGANPLCVWGFFLLKFHFCSPSSGAPSTRTGV